MLELSEEMYKIIFFNFYLQLTGLFKCALIDTNVLKLFRVFALHNSVYTS